MSHLAETREALLLGDGLQQPSQNPPLLCGKVHLEVSTAEVLPFIRQLLQHWLYLPLIDYVAQFVTVWDGPLLPYDLDLQLQRSLPAVCAELRTGNHNNLLSLCSKGLLHKFFGVHVSFTYLYAIVKREFELIIRG